MAAGDISVGVRNPGEPEIDMDNLKGAVLGQALPPTVTSDSRREPEVNKLFRMVMKHEGSDLHLKVGLPPMMRLRNAIRQMEMKAIGAEEMERLLFPIMSQRSRKLLEDTGGADFAHIIGHNECRF